MSSCIILRYIIIEYTWRVLGLLCLPVEGLNLCFEDKNGFDYLAHFKPRQTVGAELLLVNKKPAKLNDEFDTHSCREESSFSSNSRLE